MATNTAFEPTEVYQLSEYGACVRDDMDPAATPARYDHLARVTSERASIPAARLWALVPATESSDYGGYGTIAHANRRAIREQFAAEFAAENLAEVHGSFGYCALYARGAIWHQEWFCELCEALEAYPLLQAAEEFDAEIRDEWLTDALHDYGVDEILCALGYERGKYEFDAVICAIAHVSSVHDICPDEHAIPEYSATSFDARAYARELWRKNADGLFLAVCASKQAEIDADVAAAQDAQLLDRVRESGLASGLFDAGLASA